MNRELLAEVKRRTEEEERRTQYPEGFPALPPTPAARYTDQRFFELEQRYIFGGCWFNIGHASDVPKVGDYMLFDGLKAPLFVIRGEDHAVRAFYNTCQHRGAPVVRESRGHAKRLTCAYHAWTYDLAGGLVAVPHERDFCGLDKSQRGLKSIRCETWEGFLFVNLDPSAPPLAEAMAPFDSELADELAGAPLRTAFHRSELVKCNWKIAQEAFLEAYHVPVIHKTTAAQILDYPSTTIALLPGGHSRMVHKLNAVRNGMEAGADFHVARFPNASEALGGLSTAYNIFPNVTLPLNPYYATVIRFWPMDVGTTRIDWTGYAMDWGTGAPPPQHDAYRAAFDAIMNEDFENLAPMQASVASGALQDVPLSYQERRIYHFNLELDRRIGIDNIPPHLRTQPVALPVETA
jgi:phenylpropionate dioxygenase-like ring-hydroxylating dioxygenase large terminal subunit